MIVVLREIDELFLFIDIRHIQRMNKWAEMRVRNFEIFLEEVLMILMKRK
jgi:lipoprotein-releasing system permease protein